MAELEKLVSEETNISEAFNTFRELQNRWKEISNLSTATTATSRRLPPPRPQLLLQHEVEQDLRPRLQAQPRTPYPVAHQRSNRSGGWNRSRATSACSTFTAWNGQTRSYRARTIRTLRTRYPRTHRRGAAAHPPISTSRGRRRTGPPRNAKHCWRRAKGYRGQDI